VDNGTPFHASHRFDVSDGQAQQCGVVTSVPAGKLLVIEYASAIFTLPAVQQLVGTVVGTTVAGDRVLHLVSAAPIGDTRRHVVAQCVALYADAETDVSFCAERDPADGTVDVRAAISGRLVDVP